MTKYNTFSRLEGSPRRLCAVIPKTTSAPIYICPAGKRAQIMLISACNLTSSPATIRLHHVVPSETAATSNAWYYDLSIARTTLIVDSDARYLEQGDALWASQATADHIAISIYGMEFLA